MGKVVGAVLMAIGLVIFFASRFDAKYMLDMSSRDPLVFERAAYGYLAGYVGIALIMVGLLLLAVLARRSPRMPKPPRG